MVHWKNVLGYAACSSRLINPEFSNTKEMVTCQRCRICISLHPHKTTIPSKFHPLRNKIEVCKSRRCGNEECSNRAAEGNKYCIHCSGIRYSTDTASLKNKRRNLPWGR